MTKAQKFCLEVAKMAEELKISVFVVTEGASITRNSNCQAVENARKSHIKWELENGFLPDHDWNKINNK